MPDHTDSELRRTAIIAAYTQSVVQAFQIFILAGPEAKAAQDRFAIAMKNAEKALAFALKLGTAEG